MALDIAKDLEVFELAALESVRMDPLPQYGSHAFLPYLAANTPATPPPAPTLLCASTWTYCGPVLSASATALPPSFHTWSRTTFSTPLLPHLLPFLSYLETFLASAGATNYWLTIRATKPTHDYDTVRWHTDDIFFDHDGERDRVGWDQTPRDKGNHEPNYKAGKGNNSKNGYWKLATTLLGPPTLFLHNSPQARKTIRIAKTHQSTLRGDHSCTSFRCLPCLEAIDAIRHTLAHEFASSEVESPSPGEVAFFRLGDEEGAVHSEPKCNEDRIFVNVVPGTEEELRSLMSRWGLGFPRAWCFGVPVGFDENISHTSASAADDSLSEATSKSDTPITKDTSKQIPHLHSMNQNPQDPSESGSISTMSTNLRGEYMDWLRDKGFLFSQVFGGQSQAKERQGRRAGEGT